MFVAHFFFLSPGNTYLEHLRRLTRFMTFTKDLHARLLRPLVPLGLNFLKVLTMKALALLRVHLFQILGPHLLISLGLILPPLEKSHIFQVLAQNLVGVALLQRRLLTRIKKLNILPNLYLLPFLRTLLMYLEYLRRVHLLRPSLYLQLLHSDLLMMPPRLLSHLLKALWARVNLTGL